jgi:hypothetical protein
MQASCADVNSLYNVGAELIQYSEGLQVYIDFKGGGGR